MELDDLQSAWKSLGDRLVQGEAIGQIRYEQYQLDRARANLRPLVLGQWLQLLAGVVMALLFGSYWAEHGSEPALLVSGLLLHAYSILFVLGAARELYLLGSIDHSQPVLAMQQRLANLRAWRIRSGLYFALAGCIMWVPLALVAFEAVVGVDLWAVAPLLVWILAASGLASGFVLLAVARRLRGTPQARLNTYFAQQSVGSRLHRALAALDEIDRFKRA